MEESSTAMRILVRLDTACQWIGRYMYLHIETEKQVGSNETGVAFGETFEETFEMP